jgi:sulfate adenylyltransferase subunit 1 (EFTu-like GTPase family)
VLVRRNGLTVGQRRRIKHTTRSTPARVAEIAGTFDIESMTLVPGESVSLNGIGLLRLQSADDLVVDDYRDNRVTGSFVLIDERTNATVGAGMIGHADFVAS